MTDFIAFADLHIHNFKCKFLSREERLNNTLKCLRKVIAYANKYTDSKAVLFAGDLFDSYDAVPISVFNAAVRCFSAAFTKYPEIKFIAVSGNHDYGTKQILGGRAESSLYPLSMLFPNNFILLDDIEHNTYILDKDTIIHGVPYYNFAEDYYQVIDDIKVNVNFKNNILLTHATIIAYPDIPGVIDPYYEGFKKFLVCLSGDIHRYSEHDNFIMLNSPIQKSLHDLNDEKGWWYFSISKHGEVTKEFILTDSIFPVYKTYNIGESIPEGTKDFYVCSNTIIDDVVDEDQTKIIESFSSSKKPAEITRNYLKEVGKDTEEHLQIGLSLLPQS